MVEGLNRPISLLPPEAQLQLRPLGGQGVQATLGTPGKVAAHRIRCARGRSP
jgi:hypothetical protein